MYTKKEALKQIDICLTKIFNNTDTKYWHSILDSIHELTLRENRNFISTGLDEDIINKFFSKPREPHDITTRKS